LTTSARQTGLTDDHPIGDHLATTASFAQLGVDPTLVDLLHAEGITDPFPIQELTIPDALTGRDVCGKAKTGSGKTLAFGLPLLQSLSTARKRYPRALILVPTRELCVQVTEALEPLAKALGHGVTSVYGGVSMNRQIKELDRGSEVVVATPGRLIDLMERKNVYLDDVAVVVIDEADQMADMGFLPQVRRIMKQVPTPRQTMLFSATLDGAVGTLIRSYMDDPINHEVESTTTMVETMEHRFLRVHQMDKVKVAAALAQGSERTLMFVRTKFGCDRAARDLREVGVAAAAIHGDLHQSKREKTLADFSAGRTPVLVATNVAARGLHIEGVDLVVHYDPPDDPKTYLHRSGRTARAGEAGMVVTLVLWDQVNEVLRIQKEAGLDEPMVKVFSNDPRLGDLTVWEPTTEDTVIPASDEPETRAAARRRRASMGPRRRRK
jgi:superfamily II DNA/RNA helicase